MRMSIRYYEIFDVALLENNKELFVELLDKVKSLAYKNRISMIKMYTFVPSWEPLMRQEGFMKMTKEHRFVYKDLPERLPDLTVWLTPVDGDRGFF